MNLKEYITSGIIESYILGLVSSEEMIEFEKLCVNFPELVAARDEFEVCLEVQMLQFREVPELAIKNKVMEIVRQKKM